MALKLIKVDTTLEGLNFEYSVFHVAPGREGTIVDAHLSLIKCSDGFRANLCTDDAEGSTSNEALDKLERWLRRLADGIKERKSITIPF